MYKICVHTVGGADTVDYAKTLEAFRERLDDWLTDAGDDVQVINRPEPEVGQEHCGNIPCIQCQGCACDCHFPVTGPKNESAKKEDNKPCCNKTECKGYPDSNCAIHDEIPF